MGNLKGIDVSRYQEIIDWAKVDASGIAFALIKAGFGNDVSQKDSMFDRNVQQALAKGLAVGAYWFSYAVSTVDAQREADVFNQILQAYKGKLMFPVAYDFEYDSAAYFKRIEGRDPTDAEITAFADTFLTRLKSYGWFVNLYTNCDYIRSGKFSAALRQKFDVWLADYSGAPDYPCYIQQTGDKGSIPGISGNVDIDVSFRDYPTMIRAGGYNGFPKPQGTAVTIDTTMNLIRKAGQTYNVKTVSTLPVTLTAGTPGVVKVTPFPRSGNVQLFALTATGKPGQAAGIYTTITGEQPVKRFVFNIA